jgi:hypothetical protein
MKALANLSVAGETRHSQLPVTDVAMSALQMVEGGLGCVVGDNESVYTHTPTDPIKAPDAPTGGSCPGYVFGR